MINIYKITTELCLDRFSGAVKEFIGPRKKYSYERAAELLGIDERTVESHVLGRATPDMAKMLRYFSLLGPRFTNRILRLAGQDGARDQNVAMITDHQMNGEIADVVAVFGDALRDGHVDHMELQRILPELRDVLVVGEAFLAQHESGPVIDANQQNVDIFKARGANGRLDS